MMEITRHYPHLPFQFSGLNFSQRPFFPEATQELCQELIRRHPTETKMLASQILIDELHRGGVEAQPDATEMLDLTISCYDANNQTLFFPEQRWPQVLSRYPHLKVRLQLGLERMEEFFHWIQNMAKLY